MVNLLFSAGGPKGCIRPARLRCRRTHAHSSPDLCRGLGLANTRLHVSSDVIIQALPLTDDHRQVPELSMPRFPYPKDRLINRTDFISVVVKIHHEGLGMVSGTW